MLVAIDTSTAISSLALYQGRKGLLAELTWVSAEHHGVELAPRIQSLLERQGIAASDLCAVAIGLGPGSFTGLRVGLSLAKGLALANEIPLFGIPTLDALAYACRLQPLPVWAILQAGRGRICTARYESEDGTMVRTTDCLLTTLAGLIEKVDAPALFCGEIDIEAANRVRKDLGEGATLAPRAVSMRRAVYLAEMAWRRLEKGERDDPHTLEPLYLQYPKVPL